MEKKPAHKLNLLSICLPDYFGGYHKPVMGIPVFHGMTKVQLIDSIVDDWNQTYDHYTYGENAWPDLTSEGIRKMAEDFILEDELFTDLEEEDEEDEDRESVYIYISCEEEEDNEVETEVEGDSHAEI